MVVVASFSKVCVFSENSPSTYTTKISFSNLPTMGTIFKSLRSGGGGWHFQIASDMDEWQIRSD